MRNAAWMSLAAGLALVAGCKDQDTGTRVEPGGSATRTTGGSSDSALRPRADTGLDQAKSAQDNAAAKNRDAAGASKDVLDAQEKVRKDEQKMGAAQPKDERRLGEAQEKETQARGNAQTAQAGAQQTVTGTLAQASADEVRVDSANQPGMLLKVTGSTKVTLDGKDASAAQLKEGVQVRASYSVVGDQPTAVRIEARSAAKK
ncbi:MAG: hypothetical protein NVSMB23_03430 [Myxococcales bacterium]